MEQENNIVDILDLDDVKGISISFYFKNHKLSLVHAVLNTLCTIYKLISICL